MRVRTGAAIPTVLLLACAAGLAAATCSDGYSEIVELERERGETALSLGNADDAEEAFRGALDYHPSHVARRPVAGGSAKRSASTDSTGMGAWGVV